MTRRRITVVLLDIPQSQQLLALGANIASLLKAEIEGVFVEDDALFRLTGLPFLREFRWGSRDEMRLDPSRLMQEWRAMAKQTREALEESANRAGLDWSFRVWRGEFGTALGQLATDSEMLMMGRLGTHTNRFSNRQPLSSTVSSSLQVGVILDAGMTAQPMVETITELAQKPEIQLILFLLPDEKNLSQEATQDLLNRIDPQRQSQLVHLSEWDPANLSQQLKETACDLLMMTEQSPLLQGPTIKRVIEALPFPTVVVRR